MEVFLGILVSIGLVYPIRRALRLWRRRHTPAPLDDVRTTHDPAYRRRLAERRAAQLEATPRFHTHVWGELGTCLDCGKVRAVNDAIRMPEYAMGGIINPVNAQPDDPTEIIDRCEVSGHLISWQRPYYCIRCERQTQQEPPWMARP